MRSFATALIAAAFAALASAAPVNVPAGVSSPISGANPASLPQLPSLPVPNGAKSVDSTDNGAAVPSVAVIFNTLHGKALPDVDKLSMSERMCIVCV